MARWLLIPASASVSEAVQSHRCVRRWIAASAFGLLAIADGMAAGIAEGGCVPPADHQPAPDIDYQDGVDAKGWAVAPADLPANTLNITPRIELRQPVDQYLPDDRYNLDASRPDLMLGTIELQPDHQPTLDGQPLSAPTTDCGE